MNLTKEQLYELKNQGDYDIAPVSTEILSDIRTPVEVLKILLNADAHCYMLESAADSESWGRYTFLGYDPKLEITCVNGVIKSGDKTVQTDRPDIYLRKLLSKYKSPQIEGMPTFTGGLVGYFSYDFLKYAEPRLNLDAKDTEGFKDFDLMLFDKVIAFDNYRQKMILIANISLDDIDSEYERAESELAAIEQLIRHGTPTENTHGKMTSEIKPLFSQAQFCEMVERAKYHIFEGDIFQIVLSNRLEADFEGSLLDTYRVLRTLNPSPYMFYFSGSDMEVAGASPETLVKLENGVLHTFPLAGTRPRGKTTQEDERLKAELLADENELAEHNMLVDLGRNDIGKISKFGSVTVERYHEVLPYSHVMHIGSTVRGDIRDDCDAIDAVNAILPAGTLSGAPKIKACQLINDLENNKRGIYGGLFPMMYCSSPKAA